MAGWFSREISTAEFDESVASTERHLASGDLASAERVTRALLERLDSRRSRGSRRWAAAHFLRAQFWIRAGDLDRARTHLSDASQFAAREHEDVKARLTYEMNWGDLLVVQGRLPEAAEVLERNLEARREFYGPDHAGYGYGAASLAAVALRRGDYARVGELARVAARTFRSGGGDRYVNARALELVARKALAPTVDVLAEIEPADRDALLPSLAAGFFSGVPVVVDLLWDTYAALETLPDSRVLKEQCLASIANCAHAHARGEARVRALEMLVALRDDREPEQQADFLQGLALAYDQTGDPERARTAYERARVVASDAPVATQARVRRNLAAFLANVAHDTAGAEALLREALALPGLDASEECARVHASLGVVLHHAGRFDDAARSLAEAAAELQPMDPDALVAVAHLGFARSRQPCNCAAGMRDALAAALHAAVARYVPADLIAHVTVPEAGSGASIAVQTTRAPTRDEAAAIELGIAEAMRSITDNAAGAYGPAKQS